MPKLDPAKWLQIDEVTWMSTIDPAELAACFSVRPDELIRKAFGTRASQETPMTDFTETRSMLKKLAMAERGDTPTRRAAHNLLEMTENWQKFPDQRPQLGANINRELGRLESLRQSQR